MNIRLVRTKVTTTITSRESIFMELTVGLSTVLFSKSTCCANIPLRCCYSS